MYKPLCNLDLCIIHDCLLIMYPKKGTWEITFFLWREDCWLEVCARHWCVQWGCVKKISRCHLYMLGWIYLTCSTSEWHGGTVDSIVNSQFQVWFWAWVTLCGVSELLECGQSTLVWDKEIISYSATTGACVGPGFLLSIRSLPRYINNSISESFDRLQSLQVISITTSLLHP